MRKPLSILILALCFWCGFTIGEYQNAKQKQKAEAARNYVEILNAKEKALRSDTDLQGAVDEAIRRLERNDR